MEEWQWAINLVLAGVLSAFGWFARQVWDSVQTMKKDLVGIEIALPKTYVTKVDHAIQIARVEQANADQMNRIEKALDRIFNKLDGKVDKH